MKVLVVGGGGREHTIVWKLSKSPKVTEIYAAPGNGGIAELATCVPIKATDIEGVVNFAYGKNNRRRSAVLYLREPVVQFLRLGETAVCR